MWDPHLAPEAWLAFQVPGNFEAPSHLAIREVAARFGLAELVRGTDAVDAPAAYADRLLAQGLAVDVWETTYLHVLPATGETHPVQRWVEGTALVPLRAALDDAGWAALRADLAPLLAAAYPVRDGRVIFPFRRVFVVAQRRA